MGYIRAIHWEGGDLQPVAPLPYGKVRPGYNLYELHMKQFLLRKVHMKHLLLHKIQMKHFLLPCSRTYIIQPYTYIYIYI